MPRSKRRRVHHVAHKDGSDQEARFPVTMMADKSNDVRQSSPRHTSYNPHVPSGQNLGRASKSRSQPSAQRVSTAKRSTRPKRKRSGSSPADDERPSRRQRTESEEVFIDEAYIRKTMHLPSQQDYPAAPADLFNPHLVVSMIWNKAGGYSWGLTKSVTALHGPGIPGFKCTVSANIPSSGPQTAVAHGKTKRDAINNAHLVFLASLHQSGILKEIFPVNEDLDPEKLEDEVDAMEDMYNYAARFGLVPQVSFRKVKSPVRTKGRASVEVTIELPEQSIKVTTRAKELRTAQISASVKFKTEAEKYHAEHGDATIRIKDASALSTNNVKDFVQFYKQKHKDSIFDIQTELVIEHNASRSQVIFNGRPLAEPITMVGKKRAEAIAYLTAILSLTKDLPEMLEEFKRAASANGRGILLPLRPITLTVDSDAAIVMKDVIREARLAGLGDQKELISSNDDIEVAGHFRSRRVITPSEIPNVNASLRARLANFRADPKLEELRAKRDALPMSQYRAKVLDHVESHLYSVIIGATGSGKTTQVPQILLEHAITEGRGATCNVICTQPRRIAATSVARRVAEERNEELRDSVGYQVRFDAKLPKIGGSITYCTTGILLQQLKHSPDEVLDSVSHLIVDEIHERDILIDFLLIILKKAISERRIAGKRVPKVVLMSATIDSELFSKYFTDSTGEAQYPACSSLSIPGRTFPVQERYLDELREELMGNYGKSDLRLLDTDPDTRDYLDIESSFTKSITSRPTSESGEVGAAIDWKREVDSADASGVVHNEKEDALVPVNLIAVTVAHIARSSNDGAILVFLPGLDEIKKVDELLRTDRILGVDFTDVQKYRLSMLHSTVQADAQAAVFDPVPTGCRKIILSTNIAETSVTIPDVQYVIDSGKLREKRYDQIRRITKLQCTWISKSNAKQRAGRAGRVQNGNYYALYSKSRHTSLRAIGLPEMLRSDLQEVCLDIKAQAFKAPIRQFLSEAIEPPSPLAVVASVENLQSLQALTKSEELTALGRLLASLPVHPSLGKMIVLGVIFRCLDPMVILGAIINERSLFVVPPDSRTAARAAHSQFLENTESDHFALINAFCCLRDKRDEGDYRALANFAHENFLHLGAFRTLHSTTLAIEEVLIQSGLIPPKQRVTNISSEIGDANLNKNSHRITLIKALALAGTHPNLAASTSSILYRTPGEKNTMIHPSSLNYVRRRGPEDDALSTRLLTYSTMAKSNDGRSIYLRDVTSCTPLMSVLFGGQLDVEKNIIEMDEWLPFYVRADPRTPKLLIEFRKAFDRILTLAFEELAHVRRNVNNGSFADNPLIDQFASGVVDVLNLDTNEQKSGYSAGRESYRQDRNNSSRGDYYRPENSGRDKRRL